MPSWTLPHSSPHTQPLRATNKADQRLCRAVHALKALSVDFWAHATRSQAALSRVKPARRRGRVVHTITGNFIEPRVFGETMDLHPIVVLLSLMLWGSLWGVVGMCLAVPIRSCTVLRAD